MKHGHLGIALNGILQAISIYNNLLTADSMPVDPLTLVLALLDHSHRCARHFDTVRVSVIVCLGRRSTEIRTLYLVEIPFQIHNRNKTFSLMYHSKGLGWYEQEQDKSRQTIKILIQMCFLFFRTIRYVYVRVQRTFA